MLAKYAIIQIKGNQHKVAEGEEILVDKLTDTKVKPEVLLLVNRGKVSIGKPFVKKAIVKLKILKPEEKGKKLYINKFRAKSRYRRKYGFRHHYTRLLVEKIS
jgi:large subunit ribosomal protein L21